MLTFLWPGLRMFSLCPGLFIHPSIASCTSSEMLEMAL